VRGFVDSTFAGRSRRRKSPYIIVLALILGCGTYFAQHDGILVSAKKTIVVNQPGQYPVVHYTDGDTITVSMNGHDETIRFIGVDTPETHDPRKPVQCYGPAAAAFTKNTISAQGSQVRLAADDLSTNRDRYGRLLRYVYLPDGTLFNQMLIAKGYAFYYPYFPFTRSDDFAAAEKQAQDGFKGLWGNCHPIATDSGGYTSNPE
jgi:endonuclease YncB( thermonuclease family)